MENKEIRNWLEEHAEAKLRDFSSALVPGARPMYGVRLPLLRAYARELAKREDWRAWIEGASDDTVEETLLQGLVIGYARMEADEAYSRLAAYVTKIDNWMLCDSPCCSFTFVRRDRERTWRFLQPYLASREEFPLRFGVVMLLDHFLTDAYINKVLECLDGLRPEGYYARMGVAWALSVCFVKYPRQTMPFLERSRLDDETFNLAVRKILESRRTPEESRLMIRSLKRL